MALFGKKKTTEGKATKAVKTVKTVKATKAVSVSKEKVSAVVVAGVVSHNKGMAAQVIRRPRVTEKSHDLSEKASVYVFEVQSGANKNMIREAIKELYKVSPMKIAIVPIPKKTRFVRGKVGTSGGGRKAYVYLKEGEKIEIA